ncbi:hypothetical protein OAE19_08000 [Porticoccaceae bacterium]|nr:hypothetical protein [Porticoccaceae bacterium]
MASSLTINGEIKTIEVEPDTPSDLQQATGDADIISCATLSETPLIKGEWLKPGAHLDLVGGIAGRETGGEITLIKSVGASLEDLAAAELVLGVG